MHPNAKLSGGGLRSGIPLWAVAILCGLNCLQLCVDMFSTIWHRLVSVKSGLDSISIFPLLGIKALSRQRRKAFYPTLWEIGDLLCKKCGVRSRWLQRCGPEGALPSVVASSLKLPRLSIDILKLQWAKGWSWALFFNNRAQRSSKCLHSKIEQIYKAKKLEVHPLNKLSKWAVRTLRLQSAVGLLLS